MKERKRWSERERKRKKKRWRESGWLYNRTGEGEKGKNHGVGHGRCYRMEGGLGGKGGRGAAGGGGRGGASDTAKGEPARVAAMGEKIDILIGQNNWNERTNGRS